MKGTLSPLWGHERTLERGSAMSASPLRAAMLSLSIDVRKVPLADLPSRRCLLCYKAFDGGDDRRCARSVKVSIG